MALRNNPGQVKTGSDQKPGADTKGQEEAAKMQADRDRGSGLPAAKPEERLPDPNVVVEGKGAAPEAMSDKDTFRQPKDDPAIPVTPKEELAQIKDDEKKQEEIDQTTGHNVEDHPDLPPEEVNALEAQLEAQRTQPDPDRVQREMHNPTTEDVLAAPVRRAATIDPMTGQVHYAGDAAELPGGTVAHEGDDAS